MTRPRITAAALVILTLTLAGCMGDSDQPLQGYVEGTYVYVSAESAGRIVARLAEAGKPVKEGAVLARLDDADQKSQVIGAEARLAQAEAQLANLHSGKRPEELAVLVAQLNAARTTFTFASDDYNRKLVLREKGVTPQSSVDAAKTALDSAQAQVDAAERQLEVAKLPARPEEIAAAERNVAAEQAALVQAKTALDRRTLKSPASGMIEETFFEPGELVAAGQPVVSVLPAVNKRIRFFLPEPRLAAIRIGDRITVTCDNCAAGLAAEITFIATEAEFTPPVIYSKENREKLVFRVEARPLAEAASLKAGQPVDVTLAAGAAS